MVEKITTFEYSTLHYNHSYNGVWFKEKHFDGLAKLNQLHDNKYFTLVSKGIKFSQYVGVVQVEGLCIEILPKIDNSERDTDLWQKVLIGMLSETKKLKVSKVGQANVNKQQLHLLDIYFEWFLNEIQLLIRQGLIKQYYIKKGNKKALKGKLEFAEHLNKNLIHRERFYTSHQVYGLDHQIHQILGLALNIIAAFTKGSYLYSKCKTVQLDFPDVSLLSVNGEVFKRLKNSRKTKPYSTALEIARLIILNYAPNVSAGKEKMLALLFDMNELWEEYILVKIKKSATQDWKIKGQDSKLFWNRISIRPDIVLQNREETFIIDTKWKNIKNKKPSTNDLRQMFVYNEYWKSYKALLLYPSIQSRKPEFISFEGDDRHECAIGRLNILENGVLKDKIGFDILGWFDN